MCGIAGFVTVDNLGSAADRVRSMVRSLERRGPDGEGLEVFSNAVLGHRRLSIFDLSAAGRQPMMTPDRSVSVVFNGAIYNFKLLREQLEARGYRFKSNTDTEVLLHGYKEWGLPELVNRLRGMFAFALWDEPNRKLFLVRDRLGVKPLLYSFTNRGLAFASTARALKEGGFAGEVDDLAVAEFLEFGFVTDERGIYRGVQKVQAGSIVEWSDGEVKTHSYWEPTFSPPINPRTPTFDEAVEETERRFVEAVKLRLQADVPIGALLSGGVDSSLVCWAIAELGGDVTAFTIGTPGDAADETSDAVATAKRLGIKHQVLELSADEAPDISDLVSAYGEPFACASALGMLKASRAVAPSAKVLLTGDGGDDVFLGYPEHRHFLLAQGLARATSTLGANVWSSVREHFPRTGGLRRAASFLDYTAGGLGAVTATHDGLPFYERHQILGDRLDGINLNQRSREWSRDSARQLLSEFLAYDRRMRFVGEYMTKVDGSTMHYGLEARSPFLDQELWEYASELPFALRLKGGRLKAVLRELARRKIGKRVARGRKRGFSVPVQSWLVGRWRDQFEATLRDSLLEREGYIVAKTVVEQIRKAAPLGWAPKQLWYLYVLESWFRSDQESGYDLARAS